MLWHLSKSAGGGHVTKSIDATNAMIWKYNLITLDRYSEHCTPCTTIQIQCTLDRYSVHCTACTTIHLQCTLDRYCVHCTACTTIHTQCTLYGVYYYTDTVYTVRRVLCRHSLHYLGTIHWTRQVQYIIKA